VTDGEDNLKDVQDLVDNAYKEVSERITIARSPNRFFRREHRYGVIVKHGLALADVSEPRKQLQAYHRMLLQGGILSIVLAGEAAELKELARRQRYTTCRLYGVQSQAVGTRQQVSELAPGKDRALLKHELLASQTIGPGRRLLQLIAIG
jgi:hypothetical protein